MRKWLAIAAGLSVVVVATVAVGLTGFTADQTTTTTEPKAVTSITATTEVSSTTTQPPTKPPVAEKVTTTTEPAATVPLHIEILHPRDGQVLDTGKVVFSGVTEPGARVFAGPYEAEVDKDGAWRILLVLSPGPNRATFEAVDAAGNVAVASVTVVYEPPTEQPKGERPKGDDQHQGGKDKPKDEKSWEFTAHQRYGECAEDPPYDVFYGTGKPGSAISVVSEFGQGATKVDEHGNWEIKVLFPDAPIGKPFPVKVRDEFGSKKFFEFTRTD